MPDKKISELVNLTSLATDDEFVVVDADANATKRTTYGNLSSVIRGDIVDGDMPAGSIVQVVNAKATTEVINATTTYSSTGLSATITPTSATNKILVLFNQSFLVTRLNDFQGFGLRLLRGATQIYRQDDANAYAGFIDAETSTQVRLGGTASGNVLDSPATTSAVTYSITARSYSTGDSGQVVFQVNDRQDSGMTLLEVVA